MSIIKRFNGIIPLLLLLCFAAAQPGWASRPTPAKMDGPSLSSGDKPGDKAPVTRETSNFYTIVCDCAPMIGGSISAPSYAAAGETVYFTVTPSDEYLVDNVNVNYGWDGTYYQPLTVRQDENGQYYFEMPEANVQITATFKTLLNITAKCYPPEGGTISGYPTSAYHLDRILYDITTNDGYYLNHTGADGYPDYYDTRPGSNGRFSFYMFNHDVTIAAYFGTNTVHNITSTSDPDQVGTVSVVPTAMPGETVNVTSTGTQDYAVDYVYYTYENRGKYVSLSNESTDYLNNKRTGRFTMPAADVEILAKYQPLYTVNTVCIPANAGTIAVNQSSTFNTPLYYGNKFVLKDYGSIYYRVTPQSGYTVDKIIVTYTNSEGETVTDEKPYYASQSSNYILSRNLGGDVTITAVFKPYAITTECVPADGGTISVPSTASNGDQVNFTVTPSQGHLFRDLTITTITGNTVPFQFNEETGQGSFTMPSYPVNIVVNFSTLYHIDVAWDPADAGEVGLMEEEQYSGKEAQFAVMAHDGYILGSVTSTSDDFDYVFVEHQEEEYEGETFAFDIYSFIMPDEDITLTAHFVPASTMFSITPINETPERGTINVALTAHPQETVHVIIQGTDNYTGISEGLQIYYYDENNNKKLVRVTSSDVDFINNIITVDFRMPAANVFVEPVFEPLYSVTTVCTPSEGGTLSIESEMGPIYGTKYIAGSEMALNCTVNNGYELVSLTFTGLNETGDLITEEMPIDALADLANEGSCPFTMLPSDVTITATFGRIHTVSISWSPEEGGLIEGGTMITGPTDQCPAGMEYMFFVYNEDGYDFNENDISVTYVNQNNQTVDVPVGFRIDYDFDGLYFYFTMPDADVTIHVDFKIAHNLYVEIEPEEGGWINEIIANNEIISPYGIEWPIPAGEGRQLKFSFEADEGYILQGVSLINQQTGEETPLTAIDGFYTVTMPDADAIVKATFLEGEPLYLLGTANGNSTWNTSGVPIPVVNGQYTTTVYFKGYSDDDNETDGFGYFMISTANDENNDWSNIADNLLSAPSDKFPALQDGETSSVQQLYNEYHYDGTLSHRFMVPAGIYQITVSSDLTSMTIDRITPTTTINPEMYYETLGQSITVSGIEWFLKIILPINPDERDYTEHMTVTDDAGTWDSNSFNNNFVLRSTGITTVTATNSVGYITASDTKEYSVFDQEYPPLQFIESSNPIDNPAFYISTGDQVTVGDELIGVWGAKNILWAKDQGQQSARFLNAPEGTTDYLRETFQIQGRDWDQSNWVMLDFGTLYPDWETNENTYLAMHEKIASYVDHKIDARTIKGTYDASSSFYRNKGLYIYEYTKGMHRIVLSEFPVAIEQPQDATLGYPGYVEDPTEEAGKFYADPSQYMYNHYTPVNFMGYVYKPSELNNVPIDQNPFVYTAGPRALGEVAGSDDMFFFMQPKDAEVAHVWAVWKGTMTFIDDYTSDYDTGTPSFITRDVFETYQPGIDEEGNHYNSYDIEGAFQVYSWQWNRLPATDADRTPRYGKPEEAFQPNTPYLFHIAILHAYNTHAYPPPIPVKGANAPIASTLGPNSIYRVFPLDMTKPSDSTTGVDEAVINRNDAAYEIVDITYYNVMGMSSNRPFNGVNIVVTTYSDGHKTSKKVLMHS